MKWINERKLLLGILLAGLLLSLSPPVFSDTKQDKLATIGMIIDDLEKASKAQELKLKRAEQLLAESQTELDESKVKLSEALTTIQQSKNYSKSLEQRYTNLQRSSLTTTIVVGVISLAVGVVVGVILTK